ncbi:MAG: Fur family ferric uptake transcriptional regulator [Candidatus Omnitrophota bacterium]|jgi:Fur family ferric uptake transcriptional regulator
MSQLAEPKKEFEEYLQRNQIRFSKQRDQVLEVFLTQEGHMTVDELAIKVKESYPEVSNATVHRAMKLICDSGIGEGFNVGQKAMRYEHHYGHKEHDHMICDLCGRITEFAGKELARYYEKSTQAEGFTVNQHRLFVYGICQKCNQSPHSH